MVSSNQIILFFIKYYIRFKNHEPSYHLGDAIIIYQFSFTVIYIFLLQNNKSFDICIYIIFQIQIEDIKKEKF